MKSQQVINLVLFSTGTTQSCVPLS